MALIKVTAYKLLYVSIKIGLYGRRSFRLLKQKLNCYTLTLSNHSNQFRKERRKNSFEAVRTHTVLYTIIFLGECSNKIKKIKKRNSVNDALPQLSSETGSPQSCGKCKTTNPALRELL